MSLAFIVGGSLGRFVRWSLIFVVLGLSSLYSMVVEAKEDFKRACDKGVKGK